MILLGATDVTIFQSMYTVFTGLCIKVSADVRTESHEGVVAVRPVPVFASFGSQFATSHHDKKESLP
jgi:hypothetical protein